MTADPILWSDEGRRARDRGIASALDHRGADWDRRVIDQAIRHLASTGRVWTVDDLQDLLPVVAGSLLGARILAAAKAGLIVRTGSATTRHAEGHARRVSTWQRAGASPSRTPPRPPERVHADPPRHHDRGQGVAPDATPDAPARETSDQKARRLLAEGHVTVDLTDPDGRVRATVRGDRGVYTVRRSAGGRLTCTCEAGRYGAPSCSHRAAVRLVTRATP